MKLLRVLVFLCSIMVVSVAMAQDPIVTDGDKYKVLLENDKVRVLSYLDHPGDKTSMHHHPNFVLYAITPFKRTLTLGSGEIITREFKAGDVLWSPAQSHIGENIGSTDTNVAIVELKDVKIIAEEELKAIPIPTGK
jgi:quercetin dioxygenase-like cupin family protein